MSDSLWPHGLQHARLPCPSTTPGASSNSYPLSQWCHAIISSSVIPFSSHFQFFPASGSFQISQLFTSGGQSIGVSASASVLPMNTQDWSPSLDSLYLVPRIGHCGSSPISFLSIVYSTNFMSKFLWDLASCSSKETWILIPLSLQITLFAVRLRFYF